MKKKKRGSSKRRPVKKQQILILVDGAGNYYEISRTKLERSRVSDRRKKKVAAAMKRIPSSWHYIPGTAIPGSVAPSKFAGAQQLRYAGFYVTSGKAK
jgi:hypothetical protein